VLTEDEAIEIAAHLRGELEAERTDLDVLRQYVTGQQALPLVVPRTAPVEVRELARTARINLIAIVVQSLVESLYVDNIRMTDSPGPAANTRLDLPTPNLDPGAGVDPDEPLAPIWQTWQANRFDRGQSGLYRAVFTYGYGYVVVTPGEPTPVMRAVSPRRMHAVYDDDDPTWPVFAIEWRKSHGGVRYRLYALDADGQAGVYVLGYDRKADRFGLIDAFPLDLPYLPIIRYVPFDDLDADDEPVRVANLGNGANQLVSVLTAGEVAPLMTLQDQTDISSFALKSAEWYSAFRQRWIVGWTPERASDKMTAAASQMWTFDEDPESVRLGEFSETTLDGFLRSREAVLKYAATLSQTPVHELIGELVNLSAEALAAAEAGRDRKVELGKTSLGESHEQLAQCIGDLRGVDVPEDIETVWRDTSARAFGAVVDGLGKIAQMLNVPADMLWDRIPGATRQDVERWRARAKEGDSMASLTALLGQQAAPPPGAPAPSGLLLPNGQPAPSSGAPA
jgi:hypothetical protein